ncbi:pseudouridine synthase [Candidatus Woesearchaeota archaeon]|nr:pseudouridine synthase [Candidatus Woesearchaeota archaeon]
MKELQRVQKLLSNYGLCSRRKAEELIGQGRVSVNGKVITIGDKASEDDEISVDNKVVEKEKNRYLMLNKPVGCVTAVKDLRYRTVMHYIHVKERVFPVGRLDYNTSGILLLTNDGDFANKVMHPRHETAKTYEVQSYDEIPDKAVNKIEEGIMLEDGKTFPAEVKRISGNTVQITIYEGRNRIIRRMMAKLGVRTKTLERIRIGKLGLGDLQPGRYRELTEKDKENLFR